MEENKIPINKLNKFLICSLCNGYFRFAHTISECGHTFCKICIFQFIKMKQQKQEDIKCPQCRAELNGFSKETIKKDTFKQSLVDIIHPQFQNQEQLVTKRVKQLFPEIDLECLLSEFNYDSIGQPLTKHKKQKTTDTQHLLPNLVQRELNIEFTQFVDKIYDEKQFEQLKNQMQNFKNYKTKPQSQNIEDKVPEPPEKDQNIQKNVDIFFINLYPFDDQQYQIVQLKNILKLKVMPGSDIILQNVKQFILKRIQDLFAKKEQTLINLDKLSLKNIIIYNFNNQEIQPDTVSLKKIQKESENQQLILKYKIIQ